MTQVRAASAPLLVVSLALVLWLISDRLLYVGPLDRATLGWLVVVPLWAAAPVAAGFAWRRLEAKTRGVAAMLGALVVGCATAVVLWSTAAFADCQFGPTRTSIELILPALLMGTVVGGGFGLACRLASGEVARGHPWRALTIGAATELAILALAPSLAFFLFSGLCQRP
jgi:hypothetical protein